MNDPVLTADTVARQLIAQARARAADPREVWGIPWGFRGLDALTGGIHAEEMTVLMARPGVGKTAFLAQTALNVAGWLQTPEGKQQHPGAVVKLVLCEMSAQSFQERIQCFAARVGMRRVREGTLPKHHLRRYELAAEDVAKLPIEYLDSSSSLEQTEKFLISGHKPAWFGVDYIGIHPVAHPTRQWEKVSELSADFRRLCKTVAPGLILAQMNRDVESTERQKAGMNRPRLSDLRDSGSLEQDAWNVLGLHRDDILQTVTPEERDRPKDAYLYMLKQRRGPLGVVELKWTPRAGAFEDVTQLVSRLEAQDDDDEDL